VISYKIIIEYIVYGHPKTYTLPFNSSTNSPKAADAACDVLEVAKREISKTEGFQEITKQRLEMVKKEKQ
jgi:hypothetical protein